MAEIVRSLWLDAPASISLVWGSGIGNLRRQYAYVKRGSRWGAHGH